MDSISYGGFVTPAHRCFSRDATSHPRIAKNKEINASQFLFNNGPKPIKCASLEKQIGISTVNRKIKTNNSHNDIK